MTHHLRDICHAVLRPGCRYPYTANPDTQRTAYRCLHMHARTHHEMGPSWGSLDASWESAWGLPRVCWATNVEFEEEEAEEEEGRGGMGEGNEDILSSLPPLLPSLQWPKLAAQGASGGFDLSSQLLDRRLFLKLVIPSPCPFLTPLYPPLHPRFPHFPPSFASVPPLRSILSSLRSSPPSRPPSGLQPRPLPHTACASRVAAHAPGRVLFPCAVADSISTHAIRFGGLGSVFWASHRDPSWSQLVWSGKAFRDPFWE